MHSTLDLVIGRSVGIHTTQGSYYEGVLTGVDKFGNILLKRAVFDSRMIGNVLLRGDTLAIIGVLEQ